MSGEISRVDRLLRKRNQCLQHQLDVRIQIFYKEFKLRKNRVNNDIRECNLFYKTVRGVYPGLETYSQPDIRSMMELQEEKQKLARQNSHTKQQKSRSSRFIVGDSRHIARTNKSQIQTNMYSTYTINGKDTLISDIESSPDHTNDTIKDVDLVTSGKSTIHKHTHDSSRKSSVNSKNGEDIPENEHPIATLVRTMRQRICSAPPSRKVQFNSQRPPCTDRPKTAIGVVVEEENVTMKRNTLPKSSIVCMKGKTPTPRPQMSSDHSGGLSDPGLPSDRTYIAKARNRQPSTYEFTRRPTSAPPRYELLGKSPALHRQQVVGIMAELESRRTATRTLIEKSMLIHKQIKLLTIDQGMISDDNVDDDDKDT